MLGPIYRISVNNQAGVNVTVVVSAKRWKFNSSGELVFSTATELFNASAIPSSTTAWTNGSNQDNEGASDKWIGAELTVTVTPAASVTNSGSTNITIQIQNSNNGTTWPDNGRGKRLAQFNLPTGSATTIWNAEIGA